MRAKKLLTSKEHIEEYIEICLDSIKSDINLAKVSKNTNDRHSLNFWISEAEKEIEELLEFIEK